MNKIEFIKKSYKHKEIRNDLMKDAITIFAKNYAPTLGRKLTKSDVDEILSDLKKDLYEFNDLDVEFNQTS